MNTSRVIPVLLLEDNGLVKTTEFKNPKYIGDPINALKIFNDKEADELILLDIAASKHGKKINFDFIKDIVSEAFMPIGYGGGITGLQDVQQLFTLGVEKVIVNTLLYTNAGMVTEFVKSYGSQSIVAGIDYKSSFFYKNRICFKSATITIKTPLFDYLKIVEDLGVGEIVLQNVSREGTMSGYDTEVIREASKMVSIPIVASGGAGSLKDIREVLNSGASAAAAGSMFVYNGPHKAVLISYSNKMD